MPSSSRRSLPLLDTPIFKTSVYSVDSRERAWLSYAKAKAIGLAHNVTINDLVALNSNFWDLHTDPMVLLDGAAMTLLTIQYNLCAGTIAEHISKRSDLVPLVEDLLQFRKLGQFMLTEVGHGLDAARLETTATLLPSGEFSLNTPIPQAAKFMPPTMPVGTPCIAVVFARLIVDGEDRGIRPFIVPLNDGDQMCKGVESRLLPHRGGSHPINHALTSFHNVRIPRSALLGSLEKPRGPRISPLHSTWWRVAVGSIALGCLALPMMQCYATIGAMYSLRRTVNNGTPILQFRTQQIPILTVTARAYVTQALRTRAIRLFSDFTMDSHVRHGIAIIWKAIMVQHSQSSSVAVGERCGAQGLFSHNQFTTLHDEMQGLGIAEGDILVLSIKLTTELVLGRYAMPPPDDPSSLLARHEAGLIEEARQVLADIKHDSADINRLLLPRCQPLVEAIGHRMAYDAAIAANVIPSLIDLYVASVLKFDSAWYSENAGLPRRAQEQMEVKALDEVLPHLSSLIREMDVLPYVRAPIVSEERWSAFVDSLQIFAGTGHVDMPDDTKLVRAML
ncbi:acyl-CoA dehydrogenase NM domain-like protein [Obba rivulosa]|uniref:Acyl-CoA dehydrogenase NM domain-like protein n=1 Tax=Obba rivulosa TaxID=1052685 RepID=A0A8E2DGN4_9APHY|nr:acyl-CoA dehydrogenase NM domain-like protein [Obba rivulosa]